MQNARGWAAVAQGRPVGQADGGPQLHHGLIEVAGGVQGDDLGQGRRSPAFWWPGAAMSPSSPVTRAATRSTLPSTAGTGRPKAMEEMAPAV